MVSAREQRLPLVPTLLAAILVELVVHRVALQFLKPEVLQPESETFRLFNEGLGPVVHFFASLLALACLAWLFFDLSRDERVFPLITRILLAIAGSFFMLFVAMGSMVSTAGLKAPSPRLIWLQPFINLFFALLVSWLALALVVRAGPLLARLGALLLVLPLLLFAAFNGYLAYRYTEHVVDPSFFEQVRQASWLPRLGQLLLSLIGFWAFVAFYPLLNLVEPARDRAAGWRPRLVETLRRYGRACFELGPLSVALVGTFAFGAVVKLYYPEARTAVEAALIFDLPAPSGGALLALLSLGLFLLTVAALGWRAGPTRMVALGLVAMAVAGARLAQPLHNLQLPSPLYYAVGVVGLLAVCFGTVGAWQRAEEFERVRNTPAFASPRWRAYVEAFAARLGSRDEDYLTVRERQEAGTELVECEGRWRGARFVLRSARRSERLLELSLMIGERPGLEPEWRAQGQGVVDKLEGGATPPPLIVEDRAGLTERLLADDRAAALAPLLAGELAVWLGHGVRFEAAGREGNDLLVLVPLDALADAQQDPGEISQARLLALADRLYEVAGQALVPGCKV